MRGCRVVERGVIGVRGDAEVVRGLVRGRERAREG